MRATEPITLFGSKQKSESIPNAFFVLQHGTSSSSDQLLDRCISLQNQEACLFQLERSKTGLLGFFLEFLELLLLLVRQFNIAVQILTKLEQGAAFFVAAFSLVLIHRTAR